MDIGVLTTLAYALAVSGLDYVERLMRKLQMVQNTAATLLTGVKKYHHISPNLMALHWLPIRFCIDFKVLMLTYKALNGLGPRYLAERLFPSSPTRVTQSSQAGQLRGLTPREARKERTRNWAFLMVAPRLWNIFPLPVWHSCWEF